MRNLIVTLIRWTKPLAVVVELATSLFCSSESLDLENRIEYYEQTLSQLLT